MGTSDFVARNDRAQALQQVRDRAQRDADAAAHQLARDISDRLADGRVHTIGQYDELRAFVEVYNSSWTAYVGARDEARKANQDALDAAASASTADTRASQTDVDA